MRTSVMLKDNENECPSWLQGGHVSSSGAIRTRVLLGVKKD